MDMKAERWKPEARRILALAWPVMLTSLNWTLLQVTDVVVVGDAGTHEVAAFGGSRAVTFVTLMAAIGWLSGVLVFASQADGAADKPRTGEVYREGLLLGAMIGLVGGCILFVFAEGLLRLLGVDDTVIGISADVVRVMAFAFPPQLILIAASNFLEGISRPRRVMVVNLLLLPLNAVLAWVLATGHLGLPAMGSAGAALATTISLWIGAGAILWTATRVPDQAARQLRETSLVVWRRAVPGALALCRFGLVPALASGLELAGFSWLIALSTQLGDVTSHAFQIVFAIHNVTFGVALGFGSAAGVRAGNAVGEGRPEAARHRTLMAAFLTLAVMSGLVVVLIALGGPIAQAFPAEAPVHVLAVAMLAVWAPFILFDGLQVVFMFALRSLGDQVAAGLNGIVAFFGVTGILGWWLVRMDYGPFALVWASGLGMVAAAVLNSGRFFWLTRSRVRTPKS
jgi:MATE family multidrug resistance protein